MEDGVKVQIPLNSPLSTETGDMFQSVQQPKLVFNRQKWQGGYLPTSVRFEMNGWVAGHHGYDYSVRNPDPVVDYNDMLRLRVRKEPGYLAPVYTVTDDENGVSFKMTPVTKVLKWLSHKPTLTRLSTDLISVTGTSTEGTDYQFFIQQNADGSMEFAYNGHWRGLTENAGETIKWDDRRKTCAVTVYNEDKKFTDTVHLYAGSSLNIGEDVYDYSFRSGVHYWGEYLRIPAEVDFTTHKYKAISSGTYATILNEYGDTGEQVSVDIVADSHNSLTLSYWLHLTTTDTINWSTEEELTNILFTTLSTKHSYFDDSTTSSNNRWFFENVTDVAQAQYRVEGGALDLTNYFQVLRVMVPVWAQFAVVVTTSLTTASLPVATYKANLFAADFPEAVLRLASLTWSSSTDLTDTTAFIKQSITFTVSTAKPSTATSGTQTDPSYWPYLYSDAAHLRVRGVRLSGGNSSAEGTGWVATKRLYAARQLDADNHPWGYFSNASTYPYSYCPSASRLPGSQPQATYFAVQSGEPTSSTMRAMALLPVHLVNTSSTYPSGFYGLYVPPTTVADYVKTSPTAGYAQGLRVRPIKGLSATEQERLTEALQEALISEAAATPTISSLSLNTAADGSPILPAFAVTATSSPYPQAGGATAYSSYPSTAVGLTGTIQMPYDRSTWLNYPYDTQKLVADYYKQLKVKVTGVTGPRDYPTAELVLGTLYAPHYTQILSEYAIGGANYLSAPEATTHRETMTTASSSSSPTFTHDWLIDLAVASGAVTRVIDYGSYTETFTVSEVDGSSITGKSWTKADTDPVSYKEVGAAVTFDQSLYPSTSTSSAAAFSISTEMFVDMYQGNFAASSPSGTTARKWVWLPAPQPLKSGAGYTELYAPGGTWALSYASIDNTTFSSSWNLATFSYKGPASTNLLPFGPNASYYSHPSPLYQTLWANGSLATDLFGSGKLLTSLAANFLTASIPIIALLPGTTVVNSTAQLVGPNTTQKCVIPTLYPNSVTAISFDYFFQTATAGYRTYHLPSYYFAENTSSVGGTANPYYISSTSKASTFALTTVANTTNPWTRPTTSSTWTAQTLTATASGTNTYSYRAFPAHNVGYLRTIHIFMGTVYNSGSNYGGDLTTGSGTNRLVVSSHLPATLSSSFKFAKGRTHKSSATNPYTTASSRVFTKKTTLASGTKLPTSRTTTDYDSVSWFCTDLEQAITNAALTSGQDTVKAAMGLPANSTLFYFGTAFLNSSGTYDAWNLSASSRAHIANSMIFGSYGAKRLVNGSVTTGTRLGDTYDTWARVQGMSAYYRLTDWSVAATQGSVTYKLAQTTATYLAAHGMTHQVVTDPFGTSYNRYYVSDASKAMSFLTTTYPLQTGSNSFTADGYANHYSNVASGATRTMNYGFVYYEVGNMSGSSFSAVTTAGATGTHVRRVLVSLKRSVTAPYWRVTDDGARPYTYDVTADLYFPVVKSFRYLLENKSLPDSSKMLLEVAALQDYTDGLLHLSSVTSSHGLESSFMRTMFPDGGEVDAEYVQHGALVTGSTELGTTSYCAYCGVPIYVNDIATVGFNYNYSVTDSDPLVALDLKSSGMFTAYNSPETQDAYAKGLMDAYKALPVADGGGKGLLWTDSTVLGNAVNLNFTKGSFYFTTLNDWSDVIQVFTMESQEGAFFYKMSSDEVVPYFVAHGDSSYQTSTADATRIDLGTNAGTEVETHWAVSSVDWITTATVATTHDYHHNLPQIADSDATGIDLASLGAFDRYTYNTASDHVYEFPVTHIDPSFDYSVHFKVTPKTQVASGTDVDHFSGSLEVVKEDVYESPDMTSGNHYTYQVVPMSSANSPYLRLIRSGYYHATPQTTYAVTVDDSTGEETGNERNSTVLKVTNGRYTLGYIWDYETSSWRDTLTLNATTISSGWEYILSSYYTAEAREEDEGVYDISIDGTDFDTLQFAMRAVYDAQGVVVTGWSDPVAGSDPSQQEAVDLQLSDGSLTQVAVQDILNAKTYLDVTALDVEQSVREVEARVVESIDMDAEYTLLKQSWQPDVSTRDFHWLSPDVYMETTDGEIKIWEKTESVDDWNGDKFHLRETLPRSTILPSSVLKWGVGSSKDDADVVLWKLEVTSAAAFTVTLCKPEVDGFEDAVTTTFHAATVDLGNPLAQNAYSPFLYSYQDHAAREVVHDSTVTATSVGSVFILSLHLDSALSQWTLVFDLPSLTFHHTIHGMGYVGVDGTLTGGQWPDEFFDTNIGFSGSVLPIERLQDFKTSEVETFSEYGIYGNAIQQWYVMSEMKRVLSHMVYDVDTGMFGAVWLPISTKYSAKYESTSFYVNKLTGFVPQATDLLSMLPFNLNGISTVLDVLLSVANPSFYYLLPTWTKMGFLQQSLGQYAYVYHTTSEMSTGTNTEQYKSRDSSSTSLSRLQEGTTAASRLHLFDHTDEMLAQDTLSFDKQEVEQTVDESTSSQSALGGFWYAIMTQGIMAVMQKVSEGVKVNATQNQTSVSDRAKAFSQFAVENALSASSTDLGLTGGSNISLASKVTAVKTLDMFYSTSAHNSSYFGPGYVCHQFVGQCVAQSVSNRFVQGNQYGMFTSLLPLSLIPLRFATDALRVTSSVLRETTKLTADNSYIGGGGALAWAMGDAIGLVLAAAGAITIEAMDLLVTVGDAYLDLMPKLVECLAPSGPQFYNSGSISSHNIDVEAKHKYGNKHCVFMWPCFDAVSTQFTEESVFATSKDTTAYVNFKDLPMTSAAKQYEKKGEKDFSAGVKLENVTDNVNSAFRDSLKGDIVSRYIYCQGTSYTNHNMPADMAVVEGTETFLPSTPFKNENIDATVVFPVPPVQDYMISDVWQLGYTAGVGGVAWVSVKDTKVMDGAPSNVLLSQDHLLIASPYCTLEVKKGIVEKYLRPTALTPTTLAWNMTGYNLNYADQMYHAFDGVGYRVTEWHGSSGMDMEQLAMLYAFQENDHVKRSNILPPNQFFGNFRSLPTVSIPSWDSSYVRAEIDAWGVGTENDSVKEDRYQTRWSLPVFVEPIATLPAVVRALSSYRLDVYEGVTALTTNLRTTQDGYKAPVSTDFAINKQVYRATEEYVTLVNEQGLAAGDVVAKLGMTFLGATPEQAFFYSSATRAYYSFTGTNTITKQDVWSRFKDVKKGRWDFVNQEVVFECLGNMTRLYDSTSDWDDDHLDNLLIAHLSREGVSGDITPPNKTIFTGVLPEEGGSWFKTYSFPAGLAFQGPNRFVVNRFICLDYMLPDILENRGLWKRVSRDEFHPFRTYEGEYESVEKRSESEVRGWTHNPFLMCTSPMGVDKDTDCLFEWELTFTWTDEMDKLYGERDYACVNIMAQTMLEGGKKRSDVTHLYLKKDLFTRSANTGYYSLRFQSKNGAGNREQLFVWSDAYVAMSNLQLEYKVVTQKRQSQLAVTNVEIREMEEF